MRHRNKGRVLGRRTAQHKALFRQLAISLLTHGYIKTTLPKAKELRSIAERLITLAKQDSVARRRLVAARIGHKATVAKLFDQIAPGYKTRPGGYLRILKYGFRAGDKAPLAFVELV